MKAKKELPLSPHANQDEIVFWDRLEEMADIEAVRELQLRKEGLGLQNAMLLGEKGKASNARVERELGVAMAENNALLGKVSKEIKFRNERMNRLCWREAVKANFGEEGFLKCVVWMEVNR